MNKIKKLEERLEKVEKRLAYYDFKDKNPKGWELKILHNYDSFAFVEWSPFFSFVKNNEIITSKLSHAIMPLFGDVIGFDTIVEEDETFFKIDLGKQYNVYHFVHKDNGQVNEIPKKYLDEKVDKKGKK